MHEKSATLLPNLLPNQLSKSLPTPLPSPWEQLLSDSPLLPPADFPTRVMAQVAHMPQAKTRALPLQRSAFYKITRLLQSLALTAAALAGFAQLVVFGFGVWSAGTAG